MKKTVLITGTSTGIGKETALYFSKNDWNVVATMRNPKRRKTELHNKEQIDIMHLDVLDINSIRDAIQYTVNKYGRIDVVVNNAGYSLVGPFEASTKEQIERQFTTNVFGLMDVTREIIPIFREQNGGIIINIASMGGRTAFPLFSLYQGTKWAVEGFSESLYFELRQFNIKVKIIEPGAIKTDFHERSRVVMNRKGLNVYDDFVERLVKYFDDLGANGSHPRVVARTVYKAANDNNWKLRYQTGKYASTISIIRKLLPDSMFHTLIRHMLPK